MVVEVSTRSKRRRIVDLTRLSGLRSRRVKRRRLVKRSDRFQDSGVMIGSSQASSPI